MTHYFRKVQAQHKHLLGLWGRSSRYEVWKPEGEPLNVPLRELDRLLDARRRPADFWAAVEEADQAFLADDRSWIESGSGRRIVEPPGR